MCGVPSEYIPLSLPTQGMQFYLSLFPCSDPILDDADLPARAAIPSLGLNAFSPPCFTWIIPLVAAGQMTTVASQSFILIPSSKLLLPILPDCSDFKLL